MSPQAAERGDRGSGASARLDESGEESIALGPLNVAGLSGDRAADDTMMLCQNVWPCPLKLGRHPRRALDVREQQRDRPHRWVRSCVHDTNISPAQPAWAQHPCQRPKGTHEQPTQERPPTGKAAYSSQGGETVKARTA
jgi:hypothetical protein